ncbi:MAG: hypothetical protein OEV55_07380 [candidate division Zixibacteria bacterium]|nr:hypothetical protein [candidate division Zixibacteria bacterium]
MGTEIELKSLIPEGTADCRKSGIFKLYDRENLFDYMDGGAELYLSYDFQKLLVQQYKAKEKEITVEIYQMETSEDAFGVFSLEQEGEFLQIENKAFYSSGLLKLWKDNYFVRLMDISGNDKLKDVILDLGKKVSSKIDKKGKLPELLSKLPQEGKILNSEKFFHKQIVLNNLYFLSTENLLNLDEKTSAVMADYSIGKMNLKLLLISYPDSSQANLALGNFCKKYLKTTPSGKRIIQKVEEDKFIGLELEKNYLWVTFEGKDKVKTREFLQNLKRD